MLKGVERAVAPHFELERLARLPVLDRENDRVVFRPPVQRHLDPVALSAGELSQLSLLLFRHASPRRWLHVSGFKRSNAPPTSRGRLVRNQAAGGAHTK